MADRFVPEKRDAAGDPWPTHSVGEISGDRRYEGPEAHATAPWKCPACSVLNEGRLELGCAVCGAGKPGYFKGLPTRPPAPAVPYKMEPHQVNPKLTEPQAEGPLPAAFSTWLRQQPPIYHVTENYALLLTAFNAGWIAGAQNQARADFAHTMQAPPVTADIAQFAPEGKVQRTIVAALETFKDAVLRGATDEIASGEWCSVAEVEALIAQWQDNES